MLIIKQLYQNLTSFKEKSAFFIKKEHYSYDLLYKRICSIQESLKLIDTKERIIAVFTYDDIETYASLLAIWFSGRAYVPLNPKNPVDRNNSIINQATIKTILSSDIINQDHFSNTNNIQTTTLPAVNTELSITTSSLEDLAYILFTSGSTGIPKGVPINWQNVTSFTDAFFALDISISEHDKFLQMFDLSFDVSVASFLCPLLRGASIYTVPNDELKYTYIYELLHEQQITFASLVPSVLTFLFPFFEDIKLPHLKYCILTAEASSCTMVEQLQHCIPNATIYNLYGPTEATIWCMEYKWEASKNNEKSYNDLMCIGKPFKNITSIIINDQQNIVEPGEKGELCISGPQITTGYLNNPEKNKESFFKLNINNTELVFYKTGDISYIDKDGDYLYCGRRDHQVKIQGFRVELSEIELPVKKQFSLNQVVAIPVRNEFGNVKIYLFVEDFKGNVKDIMIYLKVAIPNYMLPSKVMLLEKFPINNSGKIDRKALEQSITKKF